jgi:bifunctional DNA-binding transcriptional regulator/antitoxin component of YhaV-PrlF toxin-antitoxin module
MNGKMTTFTAYLKDLGRITVPVEIRDSLKLQTDDLIEFEIKAVKHPETVPAEAA